MPTVPTYNRQVTSVRQAPDARLKPDAPLEAFGGGASAEKVNQAEQNLGNTLQSFIIEEKRKADQLAVLDADQKLSAAQTRLLYDPQIGAMNKKGKDAFGLPDQVMTDYGKEAEEITKTLSNDQQRAAFRKSVISRQSELDRSIQAHVSGEIRSYDDTVTKTYIANEQDAASLSYRDNDRIKMSIERQRAAIYDHAKRNGLPEEWIKLSIQEASSKTHESVINRMLANDEDLIAKKYFEENRNEITGKDATTLERTLEEGSLRGESQRRVDSYVQKGLTRGEAMEEARKIEEPKLRDTTEQRINHYFDQKKEIEAEARDSMYRAAANILENKRGIPARQAIPPDMWSRLSLEQRNALERRAENGPNNDPLYLRFIDLSSSELGKLSVSDFESKYWVHFDKEHREKAVNKWDLAKEALTNPKKEDQFKSIYSDKELIFNAMKDTKLFGIKEDDTFSDLGKSADKSKAFREFGDKVDQSFLEFQKSTGKSPTDEQKQKIIDDLLVKRVFVEKKLWTDPERPVSMLTEDERGRAYVPVENIPKEELTAMENIARSRRKVLTKEKAQRAYAVYLSSDDKTKERDRARLLSIIDE